MAETADHGSPPRVWGILLCSFLPVRGLRFTPTRVGNTTHWYAQVDSIDRFTPTRVGNTGVVRRVVGAGVGSPPRVWGIRIHGDGRNAAQRFTPTRVGNTPRSDSRNHRTSVHPHACGEYLSPRRHAARRERFTPTRVGNTSNPGDFSLNTTVHPHACGEYALTICHSGVVSAVHPHACGEYPLTDAIKNVVAGSPPRVWGIRIPGKPDERVAAGSPPRVWGILARGASFRPSLRFTPTRVGNTSWCPVSRRRRPVHPHACGEYPLPAAGPAGRQRFTPTRVGNTPRPHSPTPQGTVHPHACGEYTPYIVLGFVLGRFTPTRVGNTSTAQPPPAAILGSPPRVWGIRWLDPLTTRHVGGSPPRVWGIPVR